MQAKFSTKIALILTLILMLVLAGCQSGGSGASSSDGQSEGSAAQGEPRTFKIWHYEEPGSATGDAWARAQEIFEETHPDVTVEFELKTFEQIQQTAQMILNTDEAPDVMEVNKGNATAGLYSKQGLLTDLTDVAAERGWDELLGTSLQTTARYDERGIMGDGPLYGITSYGEFVMVYYNKDMFAEYGLEVPTSLEEFEAVADTFVAADVVPISLGAGSVWPETQNFYELALYEGDREMVEAYQLFKSDLDFHGPAFTFGAERFAQHVANGYYGNNANGVIQDDATAAFAQGRFPMILTGSWEFGNFQNQISDFEWGIFLMPGKTFNTGSGGNLLVVPENAENKDLAYEFLDIVLGEEVQTLMANAGGIPINADLSQIENEKNRELNAAFSTIVENDGLAFYPDWPAPGYMDVLGGGLQQLIDGAITPDAFLDQIAGPWQEYKDTLE
ncbi:MAG: extracellular solute-binding protein [Caldilineaceae bacterium]|nr:extracellular solute-binding protein [Caldilineaceae bacterium]